MHERPDDGLVNLKAGVPRSEDHIISKTLEPGDPDHLSHRVICPPDGLGKKGRIRSARIMAKAAVWEIYPISARKDEV